MKSRAVVQTGPKQLEMRELEVPSIDEDSAIWPIESGTVPLAKMHTHDSPLERVEEAILTLAGRMPGASSIHSCLRPDL